MKFVKKHWIGVWSSIVAGILGYILLGIYSEYRSSPPEALGETIGKALGFALTFFFCANALRKRWSIKRLEFWFFCFSASFSLCAIYDAIKANRQIFFINNAKQEIARLTRGVTNEDSAQSSITDYDEKKYGGYSCLLLHIKQSQEFSALFASELQKMCSELDDFFNPKDICKLEHLIHSKNRIDEFLCKLDDFENQYNNQIAFTVLKLNEAKFESYSFKKSVLKGFQEGKAATGMLMEEFFNIERSAFQGVYESLNFLSKIHGNYWVEDGMLLFTKDADAITFNSFFFDKLAENIEKENAILQQLQALQQSALQGMESFDKI